MQIRQVYKSFAQGAFLSRKTLRETALLKGVDLNIRKGKITALVGDNGSGKSTLFNIISGLEAADEGKILFDSGVNILGWSPTRIARSGIARMFQDNHIFPHLTLLENLLIADLDRFGERPLQAIFRRSELRRSETGRTQRAQQAMDTLFGEHSDLWRKREEPAGRFSYGQQRLIGLARLLMNKTNLLLLDEPTAGVDETTIGKMIDLIHSIMQTQTLSIFMIEHNEDVVRGLADHHARLENGTIKPT